MPNTVGEPESGAEGRSEIVEELDRLCGQVGDLHRDVIAEGETECEQWGDLGGRWSGAARNLAHYVALRRRDLRQLQEELHAWGITSLACCEPAVLPALANALATLTALRTSHGGSSSDSPLSQPPDRLSIRRGNELLARGAEDLLGAPCHGRSRIMVTLPAEAADSPELAGSLIHAGATGFRINCARDTRVQWSAMIAHVRSEAAQAGIDCRVFMDIAGPKPRTVGAVSPDHKARMRVGDTVALLRGETKNDDRYPYRAYCTIPEVLDQIGPENRVLIDEGKTIAVVRERVRSGVLLEVVKTGPKGERLKDGRSLNFPDVDLKLEPLTDKDIADLDYAILYADIIGYSFVRTASDVRRLQTEIAKRTDIGGIGVVAKIENRSAAANLPAIIAAGASCGPFGILIARGDLAVELGFERLVELQEEILCICEAAQVPVIFATQVLENMIKNGMPSRSEMTDASMAGRAECVLVNKGPHIVEAVEMLGRQLVRMGGRASRTAKRLPALASL
jgi:pyruvate kinase